MNPKRKGIIILYISLIYYSFLSINAEISESLLLLLPSIVRITESETSLNQIVEQAVTILSNNNKNISNIEKSNLLLDIGKVYFYGNYTISLTTTSSPYSVETLLSNDQRKIERNERLAMYYFNKSSSFGNPHAKFYLAVGYTNGLWGLPKDRQKAMLNYYFAAMDNDIGALMALGNRYSFLEKNCKTAVLYYEKAAEIAMNIREKELVSLPFIHENRPIRLKNNVESEKTTLFDEEIVEYYQFTAEKGDTESLASLGYLYFYGLKGINQNLGIAADYFHQAYELGSIPAAASLGHLYLHGLGVRKNINKAFNYFQLAANEANAVGQNGLGYMYMHGIGIKGDLKKAKKLFELAGQQGNPEALYNFATIQMKTDLNQNIADSTMKEKLPNFNDAAQHFYLAAQYAHTKSVYKLAQMNNYGIGTTESCTAAVNYYKLFVESGPWAHEFTQAFSNFNNDNGFSFNIYVLMAEMGYEIAQHNTAFMLEKGYQITDFANPTVSNETIDDSDHKNSTKINEGQLAVQYYKLSGMQGNVDAYRKIGDFYYYGFGGLPVNYEQSIASYRYAANQNNRQAMFNLGLMYEHGIGLPQDLHLAKRWYDSAAREKSKLPCQIALFKLKLHVSLIKIKKMIEKDGFMATFYKITEFSSLSIFYRIKSAIEKYTEKFITISKKLINKNFNIQSKNKDSSSTKHSTISDSTDSSSNNNKNIKNNEDNNNKKEKKIYTNVYDMLNYWTEYIIENHFVLSICLLIALLGYFYMRPDF